MFVAADSFGNLYIAELYSHRVRKVSGGIITTVAGNGTAGYNGDNISATSAELNYPYGIAVDSSGNLYIADAVNSRVREVSGGIITTVAGNGTAGYNGDNISAASAELSGPDSVAVDSSGDLYIADSGNNRIREVSRGIITTLTTGLTDPESLAGLAVGGSGVYVVDAANNRIALVSGGSLTTVAGNGLTYQADGVAANAAALMPGYPAVDSSGNLFFSDSSACLVRKVAAGSLILSTIAGNGVCGYVVSGGDNVSATSVPLDPRDGLAVDGGGNVYIGNYLDIREVSGGIMTTAVNPSGIVGSVVSFAVAPWINRGTSSSLNMAQT